MCLKLNWSSLDKVRLNFQIFTFNIIVCQAGYWRESVNFGCVPCPIRTYRESYHDNACYVCPRGKTTLTTGTPTRYSCFTRMQLCLNFNVTWNIILLYFIHLKFCCTPSKVWHCVVIDVLLTTIPIHFNSSRNPL